MNPVSLLVFLLLSLTMNATSEYAVAVASKKRCAFAMNNSSDGMESPSRSRQNKRQLRQDPRASGGLSHTAPALGGPLGAPELTVLTTKDSNIIRRWLEEHVPLYSGVSNNNNGCEEASVLGFDVESIAKPPWRPERASLPDGPATVQLSTTDSCLIVQLARCGDGSVKNAPQILRDLVNNPNIIKVGVGIDDDALELYRWSEEGQTGMESMERNLWEMTSRFDIGCVLPGNNPGRRLGLRELAKTILGVDISKNKKIQMSNWGKKHLTPDQISYAARDAWVSAAVVARLQRDNNEVFSAKGLFQHEFMKTQRTMREVNERAVMRKKAKIEYKALMELEKEQRDEKRIGQLRDTMNFYRADHPPSFQEADIAMPFY